MKTKSKNLMIPEPIVKQADKNILPGYSHNVNSEDIYDKYTDEKDINPESISEKKESNDSSGTNNEKGFSDDVSGSDLDIPGSELDDRQETIGSEDEENNYYSLGGYNHSNLDEN